VNAVLSEEVTLKEMLYHLVKVFEFNPDLLRFGEKGLRSTESLNCTASIKKASEYMGRNRSLAIELQEFKREYEKK
jgi:hypothetical protein